MNSQYLSKSNFHDLLGKSCQDTILLSDPPPPFFCPIPPPLQTLSKYIRHISAIIVMGAWMNMTQLYILWFALSFCVTFLSLPLKKKLFIIILLLCNSPSSLPLNTHHISAMVNRLSSLTHDNDYSTLYDFSVKRLAGWALWGSLLLLPFHLFFYHCLVSPFFCSIFGQNVHFF